MHCAREKLNKPGLIFATDSHHYDVDIHENDTFLLQRFDGNNRIAPLLYQNPVRLIKDKFLGRLVNSNVSFVKIVKPFANDIARKWNYSECCVPSERINNMIDTYKSKLPNEYACLHARTESDWYSRACCEKQGNVKSEFIDEWDCPLHPVSETCYKTPQQIADFLKSELDSNTTLWISSGSSRQVLQPLYDSWNVVTKDCLPQTTHTWTMGLLRSTRLFAVVPQGFGVWVAPLSLQKSQVSFEETAAKQPCMQRKFGSLIIIRIRV
jgi:hypothetical protein